MKKGDKVKLTLEDSMFYGCIGVVANDHGEKCEVRFDTSPWGINGGFYYKTSLELVEEA